MYQWVAVGGITKRGIRGGRWIGMVGMTYGPPNLAACLVDLFLFTVPVDSRAPYSPLWPSEE